MLRSIITRLPKGVDRAPIYLKAINLADA